MARKRHRNPATDLGKRSDIGLTADVWNGDHLRILAFDLDVTPTEASEDMYPPMVGMLFARGPDNAGVARVARSGVLMKGLGPRLYDAALLLSRRAGVGLAPDYAATLSGEARSVWEKYVDMAWNVAPSGDLDDSVFTFNGGADLEASLDAALARGEDWLAAYYGEVGDADEAAARVNSAMWKVFERAERDRYQREKLYG